MQVSVRIQNLLLIPLVCAIVFYSIFFGIEMMDSGFIISLSERLYRGAVIYRDFDYVRPPLSVIMWRILLAPFFSSPYLFVAARTIVILQFATIAWNLASSQDTSAEARFRIWALFFVLGINVNPVMPWHTVDGLFFLSFSLRWLLRSHYVLALIAALLAALCKQSFIFPAICLGFYLAFHYRKLYKTPLLHLVVPSFFLGIMIWYFNLIEAVQFYRPAEKSGISEFFKAGIKHYYDILPSKVYLIIFLLSLILSFPKIKNNRISRLYRNFAMMIIIYTFIVPVGKSISNLLLKTSFEVVFNPSFADVMVPVTVLYMLISGTLSFKNVFILVIVWSSSLSWGYNNILFALPFLMSILTPHPFTKTVYISSFIILLGAARILFTYGENDFLTKRINRIKGFAVISGIYTDVNKIKYIKEAKMLENRYKSFIFVNCNNFAPVMSSEYRNRAVWEYDTESPNFREDLKLLKNKDMYFILDKARIGNGSFHKSTFAAEVIRQKKMVFATSHFLIYH